MSARQDVGTVVFQALEKRTPFGVNRGGDGLVARIEVLDVVGVAAVEETGAGKGGVRVLTRHAQVLWLRAFRRVAIFRPAPVRGEPILFMLHLRHDNRKTVNHNSDYQKREAERQGLAVCPAK